MPVESVLYVVSSYVTAVCERSSLNSLICSSVFELSASCARGLGLSTTDTGALACFCSALDQDVLMRMPLATFVTKFFATSSALLEEWKESHVLRCSQILGEDKSVRR